ncbi:hypothetical protein [Nocardioides massiliensis]|uniref:Uncharacterized protein n=1 Tax=Nocardioides massiliensis TaxID=1325935 RepID=A0ABT9NT73_9ACTN|nr:hypothetical protein [Nocardioides massiliensis]MDP9823593.1 hypothetical protein [Nocardioides massiliensis]
MRWIRPEAQPFLAAADDVSPAQALRVLETELNAPRRFAGGTSALVLVLAAGFVTALAAEQAEAEAVGVAVAAGVLAVALAAVAAWLARDVIRAGRTVVEAHSRWTRGDAGAATTPAGLIDRALAGPWLVREAVAAAALLATVFAGCLVVLPLTGTLEDGLVIVPLGASGVVGFGTATWCLLATDFRAGWVHARRIGRGYEQRRR